MTTRVLGVKVWERREDRNLSLYYRARERTEDLKGGEKIWEEKRRDKETIWAARKKRSSKLGQLIKGKVNKTPMLKTNCRASASELAGRTLTGKGVFCRGADQRRRGVREKRILFQKSFSTSSLVPKFLEKGGLSC